MRGQGQVQMQPRKAPNPNDSTACATAAERWVRLCPVDCGPLKVQAGVGTLRLSCHAPVENATPWEACVYMR